MPNQIALGSDDAIVQDGGAALCGCPNATEAILADGEGAMKCLCDPANLNAFVCPQKEPSLALAAARAQPRSREMASRPEAASRPNIVMLFVDDSGYGDYGVYGAPSTDTPNVDRMAAQGARFTQWYTAHAICTPSRAALMTGRLPIRYGLASTRSGGQSVFTCSAEEGLPANETTMAELVKDAGYSTHMVSRTVPRGEASGFSLSIGARLPWGCAFVGQANPRPPARPTRDAGRKVAPGADTRGTSDEPRLRLLLWHPVLRGHGLRI